jgi:hypothetical protein
MLSSRSTSFFGLPGGAKIERIGAIGRTGESHDAKIAKTIAVVQGSSCPR